jgi:hypothetical protein
VCFVGCWLFLAGCGFFGGDGNHFDQGLAFPRPGEGPATGEAALPQPVILSETNTNTGVTEPLADRQEVATNTPRQTAVPQPTQRPLPTSTTQPPLIRTFTAESTEIKPGQRITFTWESTGGTSARIYNGANGSLRFPALWEVPTSGTLTVELTGTRRSNPQFELFVYSGSDNTLFATRSVQIPWACSLGYFFDPDPAVCPRAEATFTTAAEQQFQGGRMIWLQELDWIYVLYDEVLPNGDQGGDLQWERYLDNWTEEDERWDINLQPPAGFYRPAGGFGLVWRDNPTVQERLGWGLAPEQSFEGAWQVMPADTDEVGDGAIFIQLQNGWVARLSGYDTWGWLWAAFDPAGG